MVFIQNNLSLINGTKINVANYAFINPMQLKIMRKCMAFFFHCTLESVLNDKNIFNSVFSKNICTAESKDNLTY